MGDIINYNSTQNLSRNSLKLVILWIKSYKHTNRFYLNYQFRIPGPDSKYANLQPRSAV